MATPSFYVNLLSSYYIPGIGHLKIRRLSESLVWERQKKIAKLQQSKAPEWNSKHKVKLGCAVLFERTLEVIFSRECVLEHLEG